MSGFKDKFKDKMNNFRTKAAPAVKGASNRFLKLLKKIWMWIVLSLVVILIIVGVSVYTSGLRGRLYDDNINNLQTATAQGAENLANYLKRADTNINGVLDECTMSFYKNSEGKSVDKAYIVAGATVVGQYKKGDILLNTEDETSNFISLISGANSAEKINDFREKLGTIKSGCVTLKIYDADQVVTFDRISGTDNWYLITAVPRAQITGDVEKDTATSAIFGIVIASMVVVVVLIIFLVQRNRKEVVEKQAEIVYREQLFDILANNTDEVFLMLSKDMKVDYVSPNVERVLGVQPREIKKNINAIGVAKYAKGERMDRKVLEGLQIGSSLTFETERLHRLTNERRFFIETVYRVQSEQAEKFIVAIADRTEELFSKQSLEEALNIAKIANKAKSTFLANMSHDIRTPMNAIVGLCTLLERDADDATKVREHVRQMTLSSRHMMEILNDILDMSKIESGETSLNITEVNLSDIIKEIDNIIRPQTRAKDQAFNVVVAVQEGVFLADRLRIKRVMMNILSNAVKYTPEGGRIDFTIRQMARASKKYVRIQFIVKDNGVGMSKETREKLFEPFQRDTVTSSEGSQGTGLGMPIAKNLVDLMGGTIAVESKEGEGTTFTVNVKFQLSEDEEDNDFWSEHGVETMLVIGCGADDRESISLAMAKTNVAVNFVDGAKSAINVVTKAQKDGKYYDAAICDWQSTEGDRLELIEKLRKILPSNAPIIAYGEHDWSETESKVIESGAVKAFLVKPFFISALMDCISNDKKSRKSKAVGNNGVLRGMHFLAAEDNELNAMILNELLNTVGADCVIKHNGKDVLEEFEKSVAGCYDAILMDVQMPVMNGYEATRAIRACDHVDAKKIPIIAMTANAFAEDMQNSANAGMNAHLSKPIDMGELEKIVSDLKDE